MSSLPKRVYKRFQVVRVNILLNIVSKMTYYVLSGTLNSKYDQQILLKLKEMLTVQDFTK